MFETTVTLVGRLITPLKQIRFTDGTFKVSGRMACTERRYDRAAGQWIDGQTLFVTVMCKRGLAENAFSSLRSGDPVMAHGRLYTREYEKDGVQNTITELDAWSVGPDLQWCTVVLTRKARAAAPGEDPTPRAGGASGEKREPGPPWELDASVAAGAGEGYDRAGPDGVASDDPWGDPVSAGARTGEAAVGV